jgi:predicted AlkP superfamily phosphohydrolase/phosphomutase
MDRTRVIVIGLDSVPPRLAFDLLADEMPCLTRLRSRGVYGALRSTDPPITIPAWITMTCGRDPGELGIYGFRNRVPGGRRMALVEARALPSPRIWELAAAQGLRSVVVSVPPSYPPADAPGIEMTGCFLTPGSRSRWASTPALERELGERFGDYIVDAEAHRTADRRRLLQQCRALTEQHFGIFRHLLETRRPEFGMIVDLGPDRLHHGLLSALLPEHPLHDPDDPLVVECRRYYALLDEQIAATVESAGPDATVLVVSDHGVRPLMGGVCLNEWLAREGYLALANTPDEPRPLGRCDVDWSRTRVWGAGGYYGRLFVNLAGREPDGVVPPEQYEPLRDELAARLAELPGAGGAVLHNRVLWPDRLFARARGLPPDLMVYFDGLSHRSIGSLGHGQLLVPGNDTGPDEANHDPDGIFVMAGNRAPADGPREGLAVTDVFATLVALLGLARPAGTRGRPITDR